MPKFGRKTPCAECPWLKRSQAGWLGDDTPLHFYRNSITAEAPMPCHTQIDYDDPDWKQTQLPNVDLCAGGLIHFKNQFKMPRRAELAESVRGVQPSAHVFTWPWEFFEHHAPEQDPRELSHRSLYFESDDD
jgi:hypothetical protein